MNEQLRQIVSKAAGIFFIVTDASQVAAIEAETKKRLVFINSQKGQVNTLYNFAKGDKDGLVSIFGRSTRIDEKKGNFGISTALDMISAGPISVINLRKFDATLDKTDVIGINPNIVNKSKANVSYTSIFDTTNFWTPQAKKIPALLTEETYLNFGNIGTNDFSIIVVKANEIDVQNLTTEGDLTLASSSLEIDEYPALNFDMLLKDTFVTVYLFNNSFNVAGINTNPNFGQYFNASGQIDLDNVYELSNLQSSGYARKFTGSLIPNLISESNVSISIDTIINQYYATTGLVAYVEDSLLESDNKFVLDINGIKYHDASGDKVEDTSDYMLSHVAPLALTKSTAIYPLTDKAENVVPTKSNLITYGCVKINENSFTGSFEQGIRIGDKFKGVNDTIVTVSNIEIIDDSAVIAATSDTFTKINVTTDGNLLFNVANTSVTKVNQFTDNGLVYPFDLSSYKPRVSQFMDGSVSKQGEILDMIVTPGIVKGISSTVGIRYLVDAFKSFVEPSYKSQFGELVVTLHEKNKFVSALLNEPFVEDLENSTNPLFKDMPQGNFDWTYVPQGGNKTYSSKLLTKFSKGESLCYAFGPGNVVGSVTRPVAGLVSNLFYAKQKEYQILANETGYIDGISELERFLDDTDRVSTEKFRYNSIINDGTGNTIYSNLTMQKKVSKQQQIQNAELLCYIKATLYTLAKGEAFKGDNYDDYLRLETEASNFMKDLSLDGAIKANYIVVCNSSNNTTEIANNKIKLCHIEYTPTNSLEKVVFDLKIN